MLSILREIGVPSMMLGAFKHSLRGISEEQARNMCARVAVGFMTIAKGGSVRESLAPGALADDAVLARMMAALMDSKEPEVLTEIEPLALTE